MACLRCWHCVGTARHGGRTEDASPGQKSTPADKADKDRAAKKRAEENAPFVVPNGTAKELLDYIEGLKAQCPTSATRPAAVFQFKTKMSHAVLEASDKVMAAKPNAEQANTVMRYKMSALFWLDQIGDVNAKKGLPHFRPN